MAGLLYSAAAIEEVAEITVIDIESNPRVGIEKRLPEQRDILKICSSLVTLTEEATKVLMVRQLGNMSD